jgi:hypothetical protein
VLLSCRRHATLVAIGAALRAKEKTRLRGIFLSSKLCRIGVSEIRCAASDGDIVLSRHYRQIQTDAYQCGQEKREMETNNDPEVITAPRELTLVRLGINGVF